MVVQTTYFNDQKDYCKHPVQNCYCNFYPKLLESLSLPQFRLKYGANTGGRMYTAMIGPHLC